MNRITLLILLTMVAMSCNKSSGGSGKSSDKESNSKAPTTTIIGHVSGGSLSSGASLTESAATFSILGSTHGLAEEIIVANVQCPALTDPGKNSPLTLQFGLIDSQNCREWRFTKAGSLLSLSSYDKNLSFTISLDAPFQSLETVYKSDYSPVYQGANLSSLADLNLTSEQQTITISSADVFGSSDSQFAEARVPFGLKGSCKEAATCNITVYDVHWTANPTSTETNPETGTATATTSGTTGSFIQSSKPLATVSLLKPGASGLRPVTEAQWVRADMNGEFTFTIESSVLASMFADQLPLFIAASVDGETTLLRALPPDMATNQQESTLENFNIDTATSIVSGMLCPGGGSTTAAYCVRLSSTDALTGLTDQVEDFVNGSTFSKYLQEHPATSVSVTASATISWWIEAAISDQIIRQDLNDQVTAQGATPIAPEILVGTVRDITIPDITTLSASTNTTSSGTDQTIDTDTTTTGGSGSYILNCSPTTACAAAYENKTYADVSGCLGASTAAVNACFNADNFDYDPNNCHCQEQ